jgi:TonB family protein
LLDQQGRFKLLRMKQFFLLALLSVGAWSGGFRAFAPAAVAQTTAAADDPQTGVVLTKLSPPVYPPLARQARIMGDVKVYVHIRKDGTVESAELFSGHPMLAPTALESARKSQFDCRACSDAVSSYPMTYSFGFFDDGKSREVVTERQARSSKCLFLWKCGIERTPAWPCPDSRPAETTESHGHVTILAATVCIETQSAY